MGELQPLIVAEMTVWLDPEDQIADQIENVVKRASVDICNLLQIYKDEHEVESFTVELSFRTEGEVLEKKHAINYLRSQAKLTRWSRLDEIADIMEKLA